MKGQLIVGVTLLAFVSAACGESTGSVETNEGAQAVTATPAEDTTTSAPEDAGTPPTCEALVNVAEVTEITGFEGLSLAEDTAAEGQMFCAHGSGDGSNEVAHQVITGVAAVGIQGALQASLDAGAEEVDVGDGGAHTQGDLLLNGGRRWHHGHRLSRRRLNQRCRCRTRAADRVAKVDPSIHDVPRLGAA